MAEPREDWPESIRANVGPITARDWGLLLVIDEHRSVVLDLALVERLVEAWQELEARGDAH